MPVTRLTRATEYLRHEFTDAERLQMGDDLAQAHNRMAAIEEDEAVMKAQIKDRKTAVEQQIGTLYRNMNNRFEMRNIECTVVYDEPNVGEVSYKDPTGKVVKVRAMNLDERQMEFDLNGSGPVEVIPPEQSAENITEFFNKGEDAPAEGDPTPSAEDQAAVTEPETGPGTQEFEEQVRESMGAPEPFSDKPRLVDARPERTPRAKKNTPAVATVSDDDMNF